MSLNHIVISGNIARDLNPRTVSSGIMVLDFNIACNEFVNQKEETSFFNCVVFGKTAEFINKYCGKGSKIVIDGKLKQESYETKDGQKKSAVKIIVSKVEICGQKKEKEVTTSYKYGSYSSEKTSVSPENSAEENYFEEDYLPF